MAVKRSGLGKGIGALLGEAVENEDLAQGTEHLIQMVPIQLIDPNKSQPRRSFDNAELDQLAASIRAVGVIQPIILAAHGRRYSIIAGERRWRAARLAELAEIPAIVRDVEAVRSMEMALIENIQRADLNPLEEARAIEALIRECDSTQEGIAQRLGKSRSAVANLLRLLSLPQEVASMLESGEISEGHARALMGAGDEEGMLTVAQAVVARGLNVRQTEDFVRSFKQEQPEKAEPKRCAELSLVEEAARRRFGTRISIAGNEKKGRITMYYNSAEDLERIYQALNEEE